MNFTGLFLSSAIWLAASTFYLALLPRDSIGEDKHLWWTLPVSFGPVIASLMYGVFLIS